MKKLILIALTISLVACSTTKHLTVEKLSKLQTQEQTKKIINDLASDEMQGRKPGTPGMHKAVAYAENYFKEIGVEPLFGNNFKDTVALSNKESYNVVGVINSKSGSKEYILLGAHLDHLGTTSRNQADTIYNGANDNASGSTAILQMAGVLKKYKFDKNIILALFTDEEMGLVGSRHLAKKLKKENIDLKYVLNFDMIGTPYIKGKKGIYISGAERSNLDEELKKIAGDDFMLEFSGGWFDIFFLSDNYPFYKEFKIPSHTFCTYNFKNYPEYHKVNDEVDKIDFEYFNNIINTSTLAIIRLLENNTEIKLTENK